MRSKLVAANWKMNGSFAANGEWLQAFAAARVSSEVAVCAPYVYLPQVAAALRDTAAYAGAQNLSAEAPGAFTGEIAAEMLIDCGVRWVIVGHSERRSRYGESSGMVAAKAARAVAHGLKPIICVGETLHEREQGRTLAVITAQLVPVFDACSADELATCAIAYEPVWAIGTGQTATPGQAQEVHAAIRSLMSRHDPGAASQTRIVYGGSVKPSNALELFEQPDIDGGLIGGASLAVSDFVSICRSADRAPLH
ncbi:MAG TPA: triose-phosphate isomerase [Burkholderiaceae bacterium]|jgi:triosephosphate isomerase|nr:triose-phosphate isomerase [Burkholderiaceae bacterium]